MLLCLNSSNCWDTLRALEATKQAVMPNLNAKNSKDWAISSEAAWKQAERSTTSVSSRSILPVNAPRMGSTCLNVYDLGDAFNSMADRKFFLNKKDKQVKI